MKRQRSWGGLQRLDSAECAQRMRPDGGSSGNSSGSREAGSLGCCYSSLASPQVMRRDGFVDGQVPRLLPTPPPTLPNSTLTRPATLHRHALGQRPAPRPCCLLQNTRRYAAWNASLNNMVKWNRQPNAPYFRAINTLRWAGVWASGHIYMRGWEPVRGRGGGWTCWRVPYSRAKNKLRRMPATHHHAI